MQPIRILFFTDNFPPESNAPANRTYEHCLKWIKLGADVTVITCNPNFPKGKIFPGYKNRLYSKEDMNGIKVIRVWTYITKNRGTLRRIVDYLSFAVTSFIASLFQKADVLVATSPQLFTAVGGYASSIVKGKPWIMEVRDLWPESIKAVDAMNNARILDVLQLLVNFLYKKANRIVVVTQSFKRQLALIDEVDEEKIDVVTNGVNDDRFFVREPDEDLLTQLELKGKFIVGYIGTHGMAHNLDFIAECAKKITDSEVHFLFIGDGAYKGRLQNKIREEGISNITLLDPIGREKVQDYLSIIDVSLIPLKKSDTFKSVIPSKIFENAAMAKPILLGLEGEAKGIVEQYNAGLCFKPEDEKDFIEKLTKIKDKKLYDQLSKGGISLSQYYNRDRLASKMLDIIQALSFKKESTKAPSEKTNQSQTVGNKYSFKAIGVILILIVMTIFFMMAY